MTTPSAGKQVKTMRLRLHQSMLSIETVDGKCPRNIGDCTWLGDSVEDIILQLLRNHFDKTRGIDITIEQKDYK